MKIYNWKVCKIFGKFKKNLDDFTNSLNIEHHYKISVYEAMEESGGYAEVWLPHFYPAMGYFRGSFDTIINEASWSLKQDLEYYNSPPIKPKYQQMFRVNLITHLTGLLNIAVNSVGPLMRELKLDREALEHEIDVQKEFYKILSTYINQVDTELTKLFNEYNENIRPFRNDRRTIIALITSIIALLSTFRNEIWNYFFK